MPGKVSNTCSKLNTHGILHIRHKGTRDDQSEALLFENVLDLGQERILQRIRPPWIKTPRYHRGGEEPLWVRIERSLSKIPPSWGSPPHDHIVSQLRAFCLSARELETPLYGAALRDVIRTIIRRCADISRSGEHRSLEQQIILHGGSNLVTRNILQIDKLARYFNLCKDLGKLSQKCKFRNTTKAITLRYLEALPGEQPNGASKICYVHAEVQLILHYEQLPVHRPPRAIGCSKSACFLCDILVQKLQKYYISHSHKRLYNQWTITDVRWMTEEQIANFREILHTIVDELLSLARETRVLTREGRQLKRFGLESRAVLPLSSESSLQGPSGLLVPRSQISTAKKSDSVISNMEFAAVQVKIASRSQSNVGPATSSRFTTSRMKSAVIPSRPTRPAVLDLSKQDLPHHQILGSNAETCLDLGRLLLIFDCADISAGTLLIREVNSVVTEFQENEGRCIKITDIPNSEMHLHCASPSKMVFRLNYGDREVEVEILWH